MSVAGACVLLCTSNADCTDTEVCGTGGTCEGASQAANVPRITAINGNGSADGTAGHTANHVADGIVLTGTNLQHTAVDFAAALFDPSGNETDLTALVTSSSDTELQLRLPTTLVSGDSYTIRVTNQFGSDQTTVLVLQGEPGANGAAGLPGSCTSANCDQALPGMASLAAIELRAVNGAAGVDADVAVTTGLATEPFVRRTAGSTGGQGFVVVFLKRTPADQAHTLSDEIADVSMRATEFQSYQALATLLANAAITSETVLALASYGDVLQAGLGDATARTALFDQLARFGAPSELYQLSSTDAFILVGYKDIGEGNGIFVRSSTTRDVENSGTPDDGRVAETLVWLMDRHLLGTQTAQLRRASTLTAIQLAVTGDATVTGAVTGSGTITGANLATGGTLSVTGASMLQGAVTLGSTMTRQLSVDGTSGALEVDGPVDLGANSLTTTGAIHTGSLNLGSGALSDADGVVLINDADGLTVQGDGPVGLGNSAVTTTNNMTATNFVGAALARAAMPESSGALDMVVGNQAGDKLQVVSRDNAATSTVRVTVEGNTGNVGIGIETPATRLDVSGTARITGQVTMTRPRFPASFGGSEPWFHTSFVDGQTPGPSCSSVCTFFGLGCILGTVPATNSVIGCATGSGGNTPSCLCKGPAPADP